MAPDARARHSGRRRKASTRSARQFNDNARVAGENTEEATTQTHWHLCPSGHPGVLGMSCNICGAIHADLALLTPINEASAELKVLQIWGDEQVCVATPYGEIYILLEGGGYVEILHQTPGADGPECLARIGRPRKEEGK